ncbi:MAG: ferredoxin [Rhodovulum sulfidophilum]|uniref:Ferredoxin n=1 Tax=Rhodovulum sulfidophilum TaxID=35806 RepID=A0A2W5NED6_RHOSU|nr:MAG: ferredoxin [Rhodovulum sulfidophilum]
MKLDFTLNGAPVSVEAAPDRRLLAILREDFDLLGAREGCGIGRCGACLVLLDGAPVNACLVLAARLAGRAVVTVEGLGAAAAPVRDALAAGGAVQCGYCAPGLMVALSWLARQPAGLAEGEAVTALAGQLCRCGGYRGTLRALAALRA